MLRDTHFHLDFITDPHERAAFVREAAARGVGLVAQTVLPSDFAASIADFAPGGLLDFPVRDSQTGTAEPAALPALGFHPWWIRDETQAKEELDIFAAHVGATRYIGEVGLDFSPRRLDATPRPLQEAVLRRILETVGDAAAGMVSDTVLAAVGDKAASASEPYVFSVHAVRAVSAVLDIWEECAPAHAQLIIHWFSGTSDELTRLMRAGGFISVNPRMLESKRGRAYIRQVPSDRLLLETDLPEGDTLSAEYHYSCMRKLEAEVSAIRAGAKRS